ncbi:MAG TPA: DegT/DnrJ/EryC1/StrS family aminotransferase [Desulfomonilaceae bacterium]|nr:DegT/DnrJ/EryC1/StrS family aminotransferase [Desulfomonilaceae bacterium]
MSRNLEVLTDQRVAVVGAGYWGKNHVRNFWELGALEQVCDLDKDLLNKTASQYPGVHCTNSYGDVLSNDKIKGIVLATPASTHYKLARAAIEAGKDVLVEKPLALNIDDAEHLVSLAEDRKAVLMVGHILLYHPVVLKLKELVDSGYLGKIQYVQSNRLSMGIVRCEENILWSFAPHDISTVLYLLEESPVKIRAYGNCQLQQGIEDVTISILEFGSGAGAHIYISWMNPFKEHRLVIIGDRRMAVFEDSRPDAKLQIYNSNFNWVRRHPVPFKGEVENIPVENHEPLRMECQHFLDCITTRQQPRSNGHEGLRTLRVLMSSYESLKMESSTGVIEKRTSQTKDYFAHDSVSIEERCVIGAGTKIWHFSHIMEDAQIGSKCSLGQNVVVAKGVRIGDHCKIQNNVSIYEGVTLENNVFCGPSMVFTNVYNPRSEIPRMKEIRPTLVKEGATIGANATIVCGVTIGKYAFIGAGSVVTKDVEDYALVVGNPARQIGYMCRCGVTLTQPADSSQPLQCASCNKLYTLGVDKHLHESQGEEPVGKVPLLDLNAQYLSLKNDIHAAITGVVESQRFIMGPEVQALESEIAEYCQCKHGIGVSSGTDAILVSLMALGVGAGDEVITTPFTFFATVGAILRLGAVPVFVDIDPVTFNLDATKVKKAVTSRTKAILPVHLFGQCADMADLLEISEHTGIAIVEDAAQAIGSEYHGRRAGSMGSVGCFSFFPSKNLGAFGDGGMITTNDDDLANRIRMLRNHGASPKYYHKLVGGNFRLDAIQAAILRVKLKRLDSWTHNRIENAAYYTGKFEELGLAGTHLIPPSVRTGRHIFNQYVVATEQRDTLRQYLKDHGVETEIYYPKPMHLQECMNGAQYREGDFPVSEEASARVIALPIFPELSLAQKEYVVSKIFDYYSSNVFSLGKKATYLG